MSIDTTKIIHAPVGGGRYTVTSPIVKEDYGLYLKIEGIDLPDTYEVDFSNSEHNGTSVTMIGNADGVLIPSQFISSGKDVFAFLYHVGVDYGRTIFKFRIPNKLRPDRTDETPTPEEQSTIDQAISALNAAVAQTAQDVVDADASASAASQSESNAHDSELAAQGYASDARGYAERAETAESHAQGYAQSASGSAESASESAQSASGYAQTASQKADAITGLTATAETLPSGSSATASYSNGVLTLGIPRGADGTNGTDGDDGYSPTASVSKSGKVATITITDKNGTTSAQVEDGEDGATGATPNLTIGTVETLEPSESATASITGTPENPVLNLGIPQGEQGEVTTEEFLKAFVTDSVSGSIASFSDGADNIPLKSLIVNIDPVQDTSNGDPSPENICPISGWTGANIQHAKANLFDNDTTKIHAVTHGTANEGEYATNYGYEIYLPAGTYTIKAERDPSLTASRYIYGGVYKKSGNHELVTTANIWVNKTGYTKTITLAEDECILYFNGSSLSSLNDTKTIFSYFDITMWVGTEVGDYAPYQGRSIPISWQTEAGTVHGGTLDVLGGVLTVEYQCVKIKDISGITKPGDAFRIEVDRKADTVYPRSDAYKTVAPSQSTVAEYCITCHRYGTYSANYRKIVYINDPRYATVEEFVEAMGEHQILFKLNTPIEIQLDAHAINSLYGTNNIFADTGDTSCEYRADTTLYISRLTEPDADMVADSNITSGKYFMVGNNLYLATANIASGSAVIVGTNAVRKSLSEALNEINA